MNTRDHRSVPLDVLREFVRSQAELASLRAVAEASGVGRTTLRNFLYKGTTPHPRIRRTLALWYLAEREVEPYGMEDIWAALTILAGNTPARLADARREHFKTWAAGFEADGVEPPPWIDELRRRVEAA